MNIMKCPNCGNKKAEICECEYFPYQSEPYWGKYVHCKKCGYIKETDEIDKLLEV
jgi:transcription elongation factor Elf1